MGLTSSLEIARSGLIAHQTGVQVTGHNLANVATPGFHRQQVNLAPARSTDIGQGLYVGNGVRVDSITRHVNEALEARLRSAVADENASGVDRDLLARIESIQNELTDTDLSSRMGAYFDAWSQLSTNPQDLSLRTLVTEQADSLASFIKDVRGDYADLATETAAGLGQSVEAANGLLTRIGTLNADIQGREGLGGEAAALRDQRDGLLGELSKFLDISTVEQASGVVDVFVGSLPVLLNGESRGVEVRNRTVDGEQITEVVITADGSALDIGTGELGSRVRFEGGPLRDAVDQLNALASELIFQTNDLHAQGQGLELRREYTSGYVVADAAAALDDADATGLPFTPHNGSFQVHLTSAATGQRTSTQIDIGLNGSGAGTSLDDLAASLKAVNGINATVTPGGLLQVTADGADARVSFSDDTSGVLATLGINRFFEGDGANNIAVNAEVADDPRLVAAAREHLPGDNRNALALAQLRDKPVESLAGRSLTEHWGDHVADVAIRIGQARDQAGADAIVRENLQSQQAAISGVNADEETINLLQFQRAYQASARLVNVVDELTQTLLNLV